MKLNTVNGINNFFEASDEAFILADYNTFKILDVNETMLNLYEYSRDEILKLKISDLFPEDYPNPEQEIKSTLKRATIYGVFRYESVSKKKNGEVFWEDTSVRVIENAEGKFVLYHIRDLSDIKSVHDKLQESERKYENLIDNLPGMVFRCKNDKKWTMMIASQGCLELTGYNSNDLIDNKSLSFADIIHPDDKDRIFHKVDRYLKQKEKFKLEYRIVTQDKKEKWVWEKGQGIFDDEGNVLCLEGFIIDVTAQKLLEKVLLKTHSDLENKLTERDENLERVNKELYDEIKLREKIEQIDRMKTHFLSQISHEIRTPLNSLLMSAEMIREDDINKESVGLLDTIRYSGERIKRTIQLMLNMSEIMSGNYEHHFEELDLINIISSIVHEHNKEVLEKGIDLKVEVFTDKNRIVGDGYSVSQIFSNIINNAVKFTEKGSVKINITETDSGSLKIDIIDTGIGIAKENLNNIFLAFNQEDEGYNRKFDGSGLGLTLTHEYCKLNNAYLKVESKKGSGSKFSVIFNQSAFKES